MSKIEDGGPAFPLDSYMLNPNATEKEIKEAQGMTMRDVFAKAALQGFLINGHHKNVRYSFIAEDAYKLADAMIEARKGEA